LEAGFSQRTAGKAGEQPDTQRAIPLSEGDKRCLEQRPPVLDISRDLKGEPAPVSERGTGEVLRQPLGVCELGRFAIGLLRRRRVAGSPPGVAQREQQLTTGNIVIDERQGHLVEAHGLLVGEQ
jgi:hypothetical protein